jgi:hypothetical protein
MGYGEYGGGGSVHWLVDADEVDDDVEKGLLFGSRRGGGYREWRQHGVDYHGKDEGLGSDFTIRVRVPKAGRRAWLAALRRQLNAAATGDVFEFTLPIAKSDAPHTQIQVSWGKACDWADNLYRLSTELKNGSPSASAPPDTTPSV